MLLLYILYLLQLVYAFIYCIIYFYSYTYFLSIFKGLFFLFVNNYSNRGLILNSIWKLGCKQFFLNGKHVLSILKFSQFLLKFYDIDYLRTSDNKEACTGFIVITCSLFTLSLSRFSFNLTGQCLLKFLVTYATCQLVVEIYLMFIIP